MGHRSNAAAAHSLESTCEAAELKRCEEELEYLPHDAQRACAFGLYQVSVLSDHLKRSVDAYTQDSSSETQRKELGLIFRLSHTLRQQLWSFSDVQAQRASFRC